MRLGDINQLSESRGFPARRSGDPYVDPTNRTDIATFKGLDLIPEDGDAFETHEQLLDAIKKIKSSTNSKVYDINSPIRNMLAAMVVNMDTNRGPEKYILYTRDNRVPEGKLTNIPPGVIRGHGGYVMNRQVSHSERAGLKPGEVLSSSKPLSPSQVPALLDSARSSAGDKAVDQMQEYLEALIAGKGNGYLIKGGAEFANLHRKYLGEWAAPIALMTGQFTPASQIGELEENMTDGESLGNGKIIYNTNTRETLFDSMVRVGTHDILISSKASKGGGAAASLKGLYDAIRDKADRFSGDFWDDDRHAKFKKVIETVMEKTALDGIFELAKMEGVIDQRDEMVIRRGLSQKKLSLEQFNATDNVGNLMSEYLAYTKHPEYHPAKHALSGMARAVVNKLNDEDYTGVIREILNRSNIIQMYFEEGTRGNDLVAKGFKLVWPPSFDGKIKFDSAKSFSATEGVRGKLCFKIGTGAKMVDEPDASLRVKIDDRALAAAARAEKIAQAAKVGRVLTPGERDVRDTSVPDTVALGREKKS